MPLLDSALAQIIFAFAMIGLFALVLRWTFSGGSRAEPAPGDPSAAGAQDRDSGGAVGNTTLPAPGSASPGSQLTHPSAAQLDDHGLDDGLDDYGLLVAVATSDTADQAARVRALLSRAGIRATTTKSADGRLRVLVFASDAERARRVAGSSG